MRVQILGLILASAAWAQCAGADQSSVLARVEQAMLGEHRSVANQARNRYRHPVGTLEFFGLQSDMTVLEIWPGGGWYTEILAPTLRDDGQLIVAVWDESVPDQPGYRYRLNKALSEKFAANPELYDGVTQQPFSPPQSGSLGEPNSLDMIVTFRNAHGWVQDGVDEQVFAEFARVLKPGGTLGIVQHRALDSSVAAETAPRGYVSEATIIAMADRAGLTLGGRSEINANPSDTKDYEQGVWTLPPNLRLGEADRDRYLAIGESDRMTLRFVKPRQAKPPQS